MINDHSINFYFYSTQSPAQSYVALVAAVVVVAVADAAAAVGQFYGRCRLLPWIALFFWVMIAHSPLPLLLRLHQLLKPNEIVCLSS